MFASCFPLHKSPHFRKSHSVNGQIHTYCKSILELSRKPFGAKERHYSLLSILWMTSVLKGPWVLSPIRVTQVIDIMGWGRAGSYWHNGVRVGQEVIDIMGWGESRKLSQVSQQIWTREGRTESQIQLHSIVGLWDLKTGSIRSNVWSHDQEAHPTDSPCNYNQGILNFLTWGLAEYIYLIRINLPTLMVYKDAVMMKLVTRIMKERERWDMKKGSLLQVTLPPSVSLCL